MAVDVSSDAIVLVGTSAASSENARLGDEAPWRPFEVDQVSADGVIEKAWWLLDRGRPRLARRHLAALKNGEGLLGSSKGSSRKDRKQDAHKITRLLET